jgi:hypothetical protein
MKSVVEQIIERLPIGTLSQSEKEHYTSLFLEQLSGAYSNGRIEGINAFTGIPSKYRSPEDYYKAIYGDLPQKPDASKLFKKNEDSNL